MFIEILCKVIHALMTIHCVRAGPQVLIEFPCELVSAVVAGRWAASSSPFKPFLFGYQARVIMAGVVTTIVSRIPGS